MNIDRFTSPEPDRKVRQFSLSPTFLLDFGGRQPNWGPVGYFTYKRCVDVATPVLCDDLQWRPAGDLAVGQGIVAFDEEAPSRHGKRHYRLGHVTHNRVEKAHTMGIELSDGTVLYATPDHAWLVKMNGDNNRLYWRETKDLASTSKGGPLWLARPFGPMWKTGSSYADGFLSAAFDGEGCLDRRNGLSFTQTDNAMLARVEQYLSDMGVSFTKTSKATNIGQKSMFVLSLYGRKTLFSLLGKLQPPRLLQKFVAAMDNGGGAFRCAGDDYVQVVRIFDAGERDIAVLSTNTATHFTGGFASHNTYARPTCECDDPDTCGHPTEEFWQTCQRVVEGVYNIQKQHCRRLSLPWNEPKAQKSAQEMFQRMWDFKFTPPGRGLAQMGTDFVWKKGGACLNNPLHEDTPVLTREHGWVPLGSLAERTDVTLLSSIKLYGRDHSSTASSATWVNASVSHLEVQPCKRLVLQDNSGFMTEITTSENHRWFRRASTKQEWARVTTLDLRKGDQLPVVLPAKVAPVSRFGAQHGMFFGDGTRSNGELHQFGPSVPVLCDLFGSMAVQVTHRRNDEWVVRNCPRVWSQIPSSLDDISYIYGFLAGYFAADGCVLENGSCSLSSARRSELEEVRRLFQAVGVRVGEIRLSSTSSNYSDERELWTMTPHTHDLWEGFFLREDHQGRWMNRGQEPKRKYAKVLHIEDAGDQRVLCAVVPDYEQFVIDGFVLTSNCAFVSSEHIDEDFAGPFTFLMDMSMLGVGVGGDTRGAGKLKVQMPKLISTPHVVSDDREGWVGLAKTVINSFAGKGAFPTTIDFSKVRSKGRRIRGFGGTASGPGPLAKLVKNILRTLMPEGVEVQFEEELSRKGKLLKLHTMVQGEGLAYKITSGCITDIFNMVGACVVAGGVRRSAEIMFGHADDLEFRTLKDDTGLRALTAQLAGLQARDPSDLSQEEAMALLQEITALLGQIDQHPLRSHRWASNNSIFAKVGMDYTEVGRSIAKNGEPGLLWLDNARKFGRMVDPANNKDKRAMGANPCSEQTLESYELCCLVETYPAHHESYEDFQRTLKFAYLYAKTVTLMPTHDPRTNAVMNRNRRIGASMSGIRQAIEKFGRREFLNWCDQGYNYIGELDTVYSEWLGCPLSIKTTSVKPSGTVSLLCGATPGIHPPHSPFYIRNIRVQEHSPLLEAARAAGHPVEKDAYADATYVISFPVKTDNCTKGKRDVSIWEQVALAADLQRYWADNQVSVTVTFKPEEAAEIPTVLEVFEDRLKSISFLPLGDDHGYVQAPYIQITEEEFDAMVARITPMNLGDSKGEVEDKFCTTDACEIRAFKDLASA